MAHAAIRQPRSDVAADGAQAAMKILILGAGQVGPHGGLPSVARTGQRSHRGGYQRGRAARSAGPARHPHRGRQRRLPAGARSRPASPIPTSWSRSPTAMKSTSSPARSRTRSIARRPRSRASARPNTPRASSCSPKARWRWISGSAPSSWSPSTSHGCCPIRARCRWWTSPMAGCSWSACARAATACWWAASCARCASTCPIPRRASRRSIATIGWCPPTATPSSRSTMRSSSSPRRTICARVMAELRRSEDPVRRLVIAGGGNIGLRLARTLEKSNQVKLIERDARARAAHLRAAARTRSCSTAMPPTRSC